MPDWFWDWGFWGIVATILVFFGGLLYSRIINRKKLGFEVIVNDPLVSSPTSNFNTNDLEIRYRDVMLNNPHLLVFQLENTGGVPIRPEDYESGKPIKIATGNGAVFVAISRLSTYPKDLSPDIEFDSSEFRINPILINRGEGFYLTVVTEGKCEPKPSARIVGLEPEFKGIPVRAARPSLIAANVSMFAWLVAGVGMSILFLVPLIGDQDPLTRTQNNVLSILTLAAIILAVGTFIFSRLYIRRWLRRAKS